MKEQTLNKLWRIAIGAYYNNDFLAGSAFTKYECLRCEKEHMHSNTYVPPLCPECEKKTREEYARETE